MYIRCGLFFPETTTVPMFDRYTAITNMLFLIRMSICAVVAFMRFCRLQTSLLTYLLTFCLLKNETDFDTQKGRFQSYLLSEGIFFRVLCLGYQTQ